MGGKFQSQRILSVFKCAAPANLFKSSAPCAVDTIVGSNIPTLLTRKLSGAYVSLKSSKWQSGDFTPGGLAPRLRSNPAAEGEPGQWRLQS